MFTMNEMENVFEIGKILNRMGAEGTFYVENRPEAFLLALAIAVEFEAKHPDTQDYYNELEQFVKEQLTKIFQ